MRKRMSSSITNTVAYIHNTWHFQGGDGSQGLFVYVFLGLLRSTIARPGSYGFYVQREPLASCSNGAERKACPPLALTRGIRFTHLMRTDFFGSNGKPWAARSPLLCGKFFDFMANADFAHGEADAERAPCVRLFSERRACLTANLSAEACARCSRGGAFSSCTHSLKCSQQMRWAVF